jgi:hypothetical protein
VRGLVLWLVLVPAAAGAQTLSQRGFAEGAAVLFPQTTPNDQTRLVGDVRAREEVFYKPAPWIQFAAGLDVRANSHDQVDTESRLDYSDRGIRRPQWSVRRLTATVTHGRFTLDAGKQFIRWGKTDIVTPTDRFAPRDFLTVVEPEFLAVTAVRGVVQVADNTFDGVWTPRLTPSRIPLFDQRWSAVPAAATIIAVVDAGTLFPAGGQVGFRWSHVGRGMEYSFSYFDGFDHAPAIVSGFVAVPPVATLQRNYVPIRAYGADVAVPTPWFTLKAETAYFRRRAGPSGAIDTDDYVLYVMQVERQTGEWLLVGGYAGEAVTRSRPALTFTPDRGLSRAFVARASYTLDANRSAAIEAAVRQNGAGLYTRAEYSSAYGQHWRSTLAGAVIRGETDDFLGQYRRNSNVTLTLRYSF